MVATFNNKPLGFIDYSKISDKNPQFIAQTTMFECGHNITIWFVESQDKYYACIG